jgi:ATPase subunit of ABC transporter with duplicated ATPase domains
MNYVETRKDKELPLHLADGGMLDQAAVQIKEVSFAYPGGPTLFSNVEIGFVPNTRLVLLGENGVRCAFSDRILPSRMPLDPTPVRLKRTCV